MAKAVKAKSTETRYVVEVVATTDRPLTKKAVREAIQALLDATFFARIRRTRVRKVDLD